MTCQNPAFGHAQTRDLTEIFVEKSIEASLVRTSNLFRFTYNMPLADAGYSAERM